MLVSELVNTCQNTWCKGFDYNKNFKIYITCGADIEEYSLDEFTHYHINGKHNSIITSKILKRHYQKVVSWSFTGIDTLFILVNENESGADIYAN